MIIREKPTECIISFDLEGQETLIVRLSGCCRIGCSLPLISELRKLLDPSGGVRKVSFDASGLFSWDSLLLVYLSKVESLCEEKGIPLETSSLPEGIRKLLNASSDSRQRRPVREPLARISFLTGIGDRTVLIVHAVSEALEFIGEVGHAMWRLITGRAKFRRVDMVIALQEAGAEALPVVSLISLLVGLILAYVGAIQLRMFGAQIYVANLVGIGVVREMGAIMTGIIMAGRTGAAYAAQIGTMQVNEEIDALKTLGISPVEFLVIPRMIAVGLMLPVLTLYSDFMGIAGGMVVGTGILGLNFMEYYNQTKAAVGLTDLSIGLFMGAVFGILIGMIGCHRGIKCERNASAVGYAATSAVVYCIVAIIVATALITIACDVMDI